MDRLATYKDLIIQQLDCHGFYEEEAILNKLDALWYKMTPEERIEAEKFMSTLADFCR